MKYTLPAPNEPETWSKRVRDFFWQHEAIETAVISILGCAVIGAALAFYLAANGASETASRALGVG